jgi:hypothetical protein
MLGTTDSSTTGAKTSAGMILDCENAETALQSVSRFFRASASELASFLQTINLESIYEANWRELPSPDEYLFDRVVENFCSPLTPERIAWFHLTRTTRLTNFLDGLLPLGEALPKVWKMLIELAPDQVTKRNLRAMQSDGVEDFQYNYKAPDKFHWGPYAVLVREVAFHSQDLGQHDYLGMPEIIEDICNGYNKHYGVSIFHVYEQQLHPCIVKFLGETTYLDGCLRAALSYGWSAAHRRRPTGDAIMCFDGNGSSIPSSDIISIEFVNARSQS